MRLELARSEGGCAPQTISIDYQYRYTMCLGRGNEVLQLSGVKTPPRLRSATDWFVMSDPGWSRAQMGWRTLVSLVAGIATGYGMARGLSQPELLGAVFGGLIGLISGLHVPDGPVREIARSLCWFAPPFAVTLLVSTALAPYRLAGLSLVVAVISLGAYLDRFGHNWHSFGTMLFASYLVGLVTPIPLSSYPQFLAIVVAAVAACILARTILCRYSPARDLGQTRRAWQAACRHVAASMQGVLVGPEREARRLRRNLDRVNTMALTLDGRLGHPSVDPQLAEHLHSTVLDVEQALVSLAELCQELAEEGEPTAQAAAAAQLAALAAGRSGDAASLRTCAVERRTGQAQHERSSDLVEMIADELDAYQLNIGIVSDELTLATDEHLPFEGVVALEGARPAGVRPLAHKASAAAPATWWRLRRPAPAAVNAIQVAIATAIALPLGYAIDPQHFYWAVIGVLIIVAPANTPHERGRKVLRRIAGTVIGAVVGIAIHDLVGLGHPEWTLTVIVLALTMGAYFITISYPLFVTGLVIALVQLYALTTTSGSLDILLLYRLGENALGGVIALITTITVLPVSTRAIVRTGLRSSLRALNDFLANLSTYLTDPDAKVRLRSDARRLDHAVFQTQQVASHLIRTPVRSPNPVVPGRSSDQSLGCLSRWGGRRHQRLDEVIDGVSGATNQVRAIARHAQHLRSSDGAVATEITRVLDTISTSVTALDDRIDGPQGQVWTSSRPLIRQLLSGLPDEDGGLLRTLTALDDLDARLTQLAIDLGLIITDLTTVCREPSIGSG